MPKVTSLSGPSSNKENLAPTSRSRKAKITRRDDDDDGEEGVEDEVVGLSGLKRVKSNTVSTRETEQPSGQSSKGLFESAKTHSMSSSSDSASLKRIRASEEDYPLGDTERKSKRERMLEEKLALVSSIKT